ncbi:hypothetical protein AD998_17905 [bacterium 336/3]|nr:hypothetical protein AD998_17905 [bacterium 336/3]
MNGKLILLYTLFLSLMGCHTFKEHNQESFPNRSWASGKEIVFKPLIKDITKNCKISLELRHIYGVQLKNLSVKIKTISPSGKEESSNKTFNIMDEAGKYNSNCSGDICDVETVINQSIKFTETGEYQFIITHNIPTQAINGIIGLGLIIDAE